MRFDDVIKYPTTNFDTRFIHPFTLYLFGESGAGKSSWVFNLLKLGTKAVNIRFRKIYYIFQFDQPLFRSMSQALENISFMKLEEVNFEELLRDSKDCCIVFDDLIFELVNNHDILNISIGESRHKTCSCIYISHYLFPQGRYSREIVTQCRYTLLFPTCKNLLSVERFALKVVAKNELEAFMKAYADSSKYVFNPLLIDCSPNLARIFRLRSFVLNPIQVVYLL